MESYEDIIKKTRSIQLKMLEEVKRICEKYNIIYFADSGTLLGAIRHDGFIPWDDDIDLGMTRFEFNKFKKVVDKEISSEYFFQDNSSEKNKFFRSHAQIRYTNSTMLIKSDYKQTYNRGIFIDIFIYDKIPLDSKLDHNFRRKISLYNRIFGYYLYNDNSFIKNIIKKIIAYTALLLTGGVQVNKKRFDKLVNKYNYLENDYYYDYVAFNGLNKYIFDREILECNYYNHVFENTNINIMENYDKYLRTVYGENYMIPIKAPTVHGSLFIDLNNNYKKYNNLKYKDFIKLFK